MASLEDSIGDLVAEARRLLDLPEAIADAAITQIGRISGRYLEILGKGKTFVYVDQINGSDDAEGTSASPYKSIKKAVEVTPAGGSCTVNLLADYHLQEDLYIYGKWLHIKSADSIRRRLSFEISKQVVTTSTGLHYYRDLASFRLYFGASIQIGFLTIVEPELTAAYTDTVETSASTLINSPAYTGFGNSFVHLYFCDIEIPASPYSSLIYMDTYHISVNACVLTGAKTSLNGHLLYQYKDPAGVAITGTSKIVSNLTTV